MPNFEEHCQHSLKRYGYRGEKIHRFLDKPSRRYGCSHREFRHDSETVKLCGKMFGEFYGSRIMAENIALDHIMLDHEEEIKNRNEEKEQIDRGFTEEERRQFHLQYLVGLRRRKEQLALQLKDYKKRLELERKALKLHPYVISFCDLVFLIYTAIKGILKIEALIFVFIISLIILYTFNIVRKKEISKLELMIENKEYELSCLEKRDKEQEEKVEVETEEKEEPDFVSEENLEAQGIPSSAVMDMEDEENS